MVNGFLRAGLIALCATAAGAAALHPGRSLPESRAESTAESTAGSAPRTVTAAPAEPVAILTGIARARDGDDLAFGRVAVRLQGIAAPEWRPGAREPGGEAAWHSLQSIADGARVTCHLDGTTAGRAGRPTVTCFLRGTDIAALQVRAGHARDCPAFSGGRYAADERAARAAGHDLSAIYPLPAYCGPDRLAALAP
jgi:endonuclease YncB( thermonuclease family)